MYIPYIIRNKVKDIQNNANNKIKYIEIFFNNKNFQQDFFDLTISMVKINEDCKNNFYNWKEYKIYKK